ncbi:MAG: TMEM175 family protein, partial [Actinomycetota bacterium]
MPARPSRDERGGSEFDRALSFFDATFALALTLLVTTLDVGTETRVWSSLANLNDAVGSQAVAFVISFIVIGAYWYGNHRFVAQLDALDGRLIVVELAMIASIVILPFSTEVVGDPTIANEPLPVAVYALNIAIVSMLDTLLSVTAYRRGLFAHPPSPSYHRADVIDSVLPAIVFLASVPLAYLWSPIGARYSW